MPHRCATVECAIYPSAIECPIRVRYSAAPHACECADLAAGGCDCHLVQIRPAGDGRSMEVHFTGCRLMLADLPRVLEVRDIEDENDLLAPWACEYRQAGLCVGTVRAVLEEDDVIARLRQTGRPVQSVRKEGASGAPRTSRAAELRASLAQ